MILIFSTEAAAAQAVAVISKNMGLNGSTFLYALPGQLGDGRSWIPRPSDPAWLNGVSGYTEADGVGLAPINEGRAPVTRLGCLALRDRFEVAEMGAITVTASQALDGGDPSLQMLLDTMGAAVELDLTEQRVQLGFRGLVALGLLTATRAGVILAPVGLLPAGSTP